jgi:tetratricopeptide (TPR) repeat protein
MPPEEEPQEIQDQYTREPLTPAKRKRLQQCFEHASKQMAQENYDYAVELFAQCVIGDPSNLIYAQNYLGNLKKKYSNNRTGAKLAQFKERGARSAMKKGIAQGKWDDVIRNGLKVLAVNPWETIILQGMATACENMGDTESEMVYLKAALESNPKDPDVNVQCADALAVRKQFDQAIACLHRVELIRPDDEEIQRKIAALAVEKTIYQGKYDEDISGPRTAQAGQSKQPQRVTTVEEKIQQRINRNPQELANYFELAQVHLNNEKYKEAEAVLAKAYEVSGGDDDVREKWEDAELRHLRQQIGEAKKDGDEELQESLFRELKEKEMIVFKKRAERYPSNLAFKYDLGLRYQMNEMYNEAIREFQMARNDPRRKGVCMLALGQCFEKISQNTLALTHYKSAIEDIPDRDVESKKEALLLVGRLCMAMRDFDGAEKYLSTLAGLDFAYKGVSDLLARVGKMRTDPNMSDPGPAADA